MKIKDLTITYKNSPLHLCIYEKGKEAPSIIFIPGLTLHTGIYTNFIPKIDVFRLLFEKGFNVIGIDLQGHGKSGGERGVFTYEDLIGNVVAVVDFVSLNYNQRIGIFGTSLGGIIAFYAALTDSRVKSVISHFILDLKNIYSCVKYLKIYRKSFFLARHIIPFLCRLFPQIFLPVQILIRPQQLFENVEFVEKWKKDPLCVKKYRLSSFCSLFLNPQNKPEIEKMRTPTAIVIGERDSLISIEYIKDFFEKLQCYKKLFIIPNGRHMLPLQNQNEIVNFATEWFNETL